MESSFNASNWQVLATRLFFLNPHPRSLCSSLSQQSKIELGFFHSGLIYAIHNTCRVVVKRLRNSVISPVVEKSSMAVEMSTNRAYSGKKNQGKVTKRISKVEREKTKREHLKELFLALSNALELSEQNNGKAFVLDEAICMVKNTLDEIDSLGKENAALLSESQYLSMEKKELQDENSALEAQTGKLQCAFKGRVSCSQLNLNVAPPECELQELESLGDDHHHRLACMEPVANPLYLVLVCSQEPARQNLQPVVSKPHPRYPTAADTWSSGFLKTNQS